MNETFIINDIDELVEKSRLIVYNNFGKWDTNESEVSLDSEVINKQELDQLLSYKESFSIVKEKVKKQRNKRTKKIRYILDEIIFLDIIDSLNQRMVSNTIKSLVDKGLIESGFDSEANDFVFWVKEKNDTN
jgi:hypothetical protein